MAQLKFFTKPQCKNAKKQLELLQLAGHTVQVIDLITHDWTVDELEFYFKDETPKDWFNLKAPNVKSGEITPSSYTKDETIALLLADHLLIRRPILQVNDDFLIGFDKDQIDKWIGLKAQKEGDKYKFDKDVTTCKTGGGVC